MVTSAARYAGVVACCALLAVGCGTTSSSSGQPSSVDRTAATTIDGSGQPTARTSPEGGGAPTQPPPAASAPSDPGACVTGQVVVDASTMGAAMGHRGVRLNFSIARESESCTLSGYPGVDTGAGGPLQHAERTLRGYMGGLPQGDDTAPTVLLDIGHRAQAVVEGVAFDASGNQCPTYTDLRVTPPNTTGTVTVSVGIESCHIQVHPVTAPQS